MDWENKIFNIDNIKLFQKWRKENKEPFIDAIITDPPYNISRKNNFKTIGRQGIDFGAWDYDFDQTKWIKLVSPFVKKGGSIIIFNDYKNFGDICKTLENNGFIVKDLIRWIKSNPMPRNTRRRYVTDFELAIWAVKPGKKWVFNKSEDIKYKRPEIISSTVASGKNRIHPTQKPLSVIEELILTHTRKNDLVFDPFLGSGTTAIVCLKHDRRYLGTEIDKEYYEKSIKRINEFKSL
ncbi:DNA-methyltransferase [Mycoplasma sp. Sp48II]|uniref:DNA-methyltransferase n=1 Tax=unclassified Mycoplasma TaxID=2683645 RepID=UPI003AAEC73A